MGEGAPMIYPVNSLNVWTVPQFVMFSVLLLKAIYGRYKQIIMHMRYWCHHSAIGVTLENMM